MISIDGSTCRGYPGTLQTFGYLIQPVISIPQVNGAGMFVNEADRYAPTFFPNIQPENNPSRPKLCPLFVAKFSNPSEYKLNYEFMLYKNKEFIEKLDCNNASVYPSGPILPGSSGVYRAFRFNGITNWKNINAVPSVYWHDVCFGNNLFVAVGNRGSNNVMKSSDGTNWVSVNDTGLKACWYSVCYGNKFVAVGQSWTDDSLYYTENGESWSSTPTSTSMTYKMFNDTVSAAAKFVTPSIHNGARYMVSTDGVTWTTGNLPNTADWRTVVWTGSYYLVFANNNYSKFLRSSDGVNWQEISFAYSCRWVKAIKVADKVFVLSTEGTPALIYTEDSGQTWTSTGLPSNHLWHGFAKGTTNYIVTSLDGYVAESKDLTVWNISKSVGGRFLYDVIFDYNSYVAISGDDDARIIYSGNGEHWIPIYEAELSAWHSLTSGTAAQTFVSIAMWSEYNAVVSGDYATNFNETDAFSIISRVWYTDDDDNIVGDVYPTYSASSDVFVSQAGLNSYKIKSSIYDASVDVVTRGNIIYASTYTSITQYIQDLIYSYAGGAAPVSLQMLVNNLWKCTPTIGDKVGVYGLVEDPNMSINTFIITLKSTLESFAAYVTQLIPNNNELPDRLKPFYGQIDSLLSTLIDLSSHDKIYQDNVDLNNHDSILLGLSYVCDLLSQI